MDGEEKVSIFSSESAGSMKKSAKQFALYLIVGGLATLVEWGLFWLLNTPLGVGYAAALTVAYAVSTFANWGFGKLILFHEKQNVFKELAKIYLTSIAGWLLNLLIMWIMVDKLLVSELLSKMAATGIVFFWNFLVRKLVIYKI